MSTPFVSGAIALALDAAPGLTPVQVDSLLQTSAEDWGPPGKDNHFGWGLLDGLALVSAAAGGPPAATVFPEPRGDRRQRPRRRPVVDELRRRRGRPVDADRGDRARRRTCRSCRWWFFGFCLAYDWSPDLGARLIDPAGAVLHQSNCTLVGDCGAVGLQETVYAMPTVAGSYRLEVYPNDADPNLGAGGGGGLPRLALERDVWGRRGDRAGAARRLLARSTTAPASRPPTPPATATTPRSSTAPAGTSAASEVG